MNLLLYRARRFLLRTFVPERVWPTTVTLDGAEIRVRNAPYSFGVKRVLTRGTYEADERRLLSAILQPGDVVIEMGGSIGILTAIIAQKVGKSGFVISVEGSNELTQYSKTWLEARGNIKVLVGFGFPVWELQHAIEVEKFEEKWGSMSGQLTFSTASPADRARTGASTHPLYDLKALSAFATRPPTTLVVDIEGTERIIGTQAPDFPPTLKNLLIELHPSIYGEETKAQVVRSITASGFKQVAEEDNVFLFARVE